MNFNQRWSYISLKSWVNSISQIKRWVNWIGRFTLHYIAGWTMFSLCANLSLHCEVFVLVLITVAPKYTVMHTVTKTLTAWVHCCLRHTTCTTSDFAHNAPIQFQELCQCSTMLTTYSMWLLIVVIISSIVHGTLVSCTTGHYASLHSCYHAVHHAASIDVHSIKSIWEW